MLGQNPAFDVVGAANDGECAVELLHREQPDVLIVDSIQTLYNEENESSPGSVSQVKDCTMTMMQLSKSQGITVFVVVVAIIVGCNAGNPLMHMSLLYQ